MKKIILYSLLSSWVLLIWGCGSDNNVEFTRHENQIDVMVNDKHITSYLFGTHMSKPALYPLLSPSGENVTRGYPFEQLEGESTDHPHQTGVYFTYGTKGEVNGLNFWANPHDRPPFTMDPKLPQIRQEQILEMKGGRGKGILETVNHWVDYDNKPVLEENRVMEFFVQDDEYIIDFTIRLTAVDTTVTFGDTKEGLFAIRVADWIAEGARGTLYQSTGEYLNAQGERTEANIWGKRSEWMRLEGEKDGKKVGVAIFHHPESVNYPTYWHARGYGLFSANPLGQFEFQKDRGYDDPQPFSLKLDAGESALFKFRMLIYDGERDKEQLDPVFNNFTGN
jgi:hypothetical protein